MVAGARFWVVESTKKLKCAHVAITGEVSRFGVDYISLCFVFCLKVILVSILPRMPVLVIWASEFS